MKEDLLAAWHFVPYAAIAGLAVSALDYLSSHLIGERSVLGLRYGGVGDTAKWVSVWTIGAAVGGFVGVAAQLLQETLIAAVVVAVTWPVLLKQIAKSIQNDEPEQADASEEPG